MNEKEGADSGPRQANDLRLEAERRLRNKVAAPGEAEAEVDVRTLLHELQVHQIELEMQNEALQRAQSSAQAASEKYYDLFDFAPVACFLWDREGRILEANRAGSALLGLDPKTAIQKRFGQFVVMEDRPAITDFCERVLTTEGKHICEVRLLRDGQPVHVLVEGIAARYRQRRRRVCRAAVIDVTLQKRADELAATNQTLQSEIAARKRADEYLIQAKEVAEAVNAAKSQLLANLSYELWTPINAILGMIDAALLKTGDPAVRDCLLTAKGSADLFLTLLDNLLDSAKIESGKLETVERLAGSGCSIVPSRDPSYPIPRTQPPIPNPQSPIPNTSPFNLEEAMVRLGGEKEIFREMVEFFFSDGLRLLTEIRAAAAAGDAAVVERKAHRLKGTVLYLGAEAASEAVGRVEVLGRSGDLTDAAHAIGSMEMEVTRLAKALRPYTQVTARSGL